MHVERVERDETPVLFLRAAGDAPEVARRLWERLEAAIGDLRGRRFYGTFDPEAGEYRACVEPRDGDDAAALGLERGAIAGGAYLRARLRGEPPGLYDGIGPASLELERSGVRDRSRPDVEHYRRRDEVAVLMPVR